MRRLFTFLPLFFASFLSFSQAPVRYAAWEHPVLKRLENKDSLVAAFTRNNGDTLVNLAVLLKKESLLYYFTEYGQVFDTLHLEHELQEDLIGKRLDAFAFYKQKLTVYRPILLQAKDWLREEGVGEAPPDPQIKNVLSLSAVAKASFALEKLLAIETYERETDRLVAEFDWNKKHPADTLVKKTLREGEKPGRMTTYKTVVGILSVYINADSLSFIRRATVQDKSNTIYFYDWHDAVVDSLQVKQNKLPALLKEKTDVFSLYRGFLEWQLQSVKDNDLAAQQAINIQRVKAWSRRNYAVYHESNLKEARAALKDFKEQENFLFNKISLLSNADERLLNYQVFQGKYAKQSMSRLWMGEFGWATQNSFTRGEKEYELTNHLGNVLATVGDKKIAHSKPDGTVEYYTADVITATDYYPGGMLMPGRKYNAGDYAYGFGGKRKDNEMYGEGNAYDFEARIFDPRIVRWMSVDPMSSAYPHQSPYVAMSNNLINRVDPTGMGDYYGKDGKLLGSDGKTVTVGKGKKARQVSDDKAYVAESVVLGENGLVTSAVNSKELSVSNSTLNMFANTVAGESSGDKTESYALASAIANISQHRNKSILKTLQTEGIYGYRDGGNTSTYKNNAEYSMEAAINTLTGGTDYSNGAIRWDGFDLAAKGFSHIKPRTYGVEIGEGNFNDFKAAWPDKTIKAFSGGTYTSFASDFSSGIHQATEGDNSGRCLLKSTAVHGRTIFWGINRDPIYLHIAPFVKEVPIMPYLPFSPTKMVPTTWSEHINAGFKGWKGL